MDGFQQIIYICCLWQDLRLVYLAIGVPLFKVNLSWAALDGGQGGPYPPSGNSQVAIKVSLETILVRTSSA